MTVEKPVYTIPATATVGGTTHISDHNYIRDALLELKDDFVVPNGGATGQVLAKSSDTSGDLAWVNQTGGGGPGTTDHSLLINRDLANQHTTASITGLDTTLAGKAPTSHTHTTASIVSGTFTAAFLPAGVELVADKVKNGGSSYPTRSSVVGARTDLTVVWIGDTDPTGASNGDRWIKTA